MNSETFTIETSSSASSIKEAEETAVADRTVKYCLNCGQEISGNFCSNCGQPTSVSERISNRTFWKSVLLCFSRLGKSFFHTLVKLSYKPWEVIRDFIHGRQIPYSHPITMLIQLTLVMTFIAAICKGLFDIDFFSPENYQGNWIVRALKENIVIRLSWCAVPFICSVYVVYWNYGSRRFSFGEYLIAAIYLIISLRIYSALYKFVSFLGDKESDITYSVQILALFVGGVFGIITLFKAFPIKSKWIRYRQLILFLGLSLVFFLIYVIFFTLIDDLLQGQVEQNWVYAIIEEIF